MERPLLELLAYPLLGNLEDGAELGGSAAMATELWHRLPEAILERILLLMPARSICRFRAVCKGWRCLLSSGTFFRCKDAVAPSPPLVCSIELAVRIRGGVDERAEEGPPRHCVPVTRPKPYRWDLSFIPHCQEALPETQQSQPPPPEDDAPAVDEPPACHWSVNEKVDSLDGLLCVTPGGGGGGGGRRGGLLRDMVVVNPATRTYRRLPPVPAKYLGRDLRSGRVALDSPFGSSFTLTWHMQSQHHPFGRGGDWVVGVYSSQSHSWSVCDGPLPATDAATWAGTVDSEVCRGLLYRLVKSGGGGAWRDSSSCRCVVYGVGTGRFVKQGEAPTPEVVVPAAVAPQGWNAETKWSLLEHCGSMYLIAQVVLIPGQMMYGFEIWKLDVGGDVPAAASAQVTFERVGGNPAHFVQRLFPNPRRPNDLPLRAMSSVGDHICLVLGGDDDDSSGRDRRGLGAAAGYEDELRHVVAFDVPRREWQLLYEECGDEDSLVPVGEGPQEGDMDRRTSLPSYPFMVPNFHVFL